MTSLPSIASAMSLTRRGIGGQRRGRAASAVRREPGRQCKMAGPLVADAMVEIAHKATGIDAFDAETYRETKHRA